MRQTPKLNLPRPSVRAATYRLPEDAHALIEAAVARAAIKGDRLTKDAAVTAALRGFYGDGKDPRV
jgi:hypothetical protein